MPKNVKQTLQGANLDITGYKFKSREKLLELIEQDYRDCQMFVGLHVPDKLYMTFDQFQILENDFNRLDEAAHRIYRTGQGFVMEVHVVDAPEWIDVEALTGYRPEDEREFERVLEEATDG